jgi:hypothetical protein
MNTELIINHINHYGFLTLKNIIPTTDFHPESVAFLLNAEKFSDGVITSIPQPYMAAISQRIKSIIPDLAKALDLKIALKFSHDEKLAIET